MSTLSPRATQRRSDEATKGRPAVGPLTAVRGSERGSRRRRAFSLAELMIALAILGLGLLVIAAALPVGAQYTKKSVDLATGEAAAENAMELIEQSVCLRQSIQSGGVLVRPPILFQPRDSTKAGIPATDPNDATRLYEPIIKVRPLVTQNILAQPGTAHGQELTITTDAQWPWTEAAIQNCLYRVRGLLPTLTTTEWDCIVPPGTVGGPWLQPALSGAALVYPPIGPDTTFYPVGFQGLGVGVQGNDNQAYRTRPVRSPVQAAGWTGAETTRALDRRIVWAAFYRRVSYEAGSDPRLYELIVVVSRLPSERHRFPVQDPATGGMPAPGTGLYLRSGGVPVATLAPVPFLVSFALNGLPVLQGSVDYVDPGTDPSRPLMNTFTAPSHLVFIANNAVADLLPAGSIFIPAVNDFVPSLAGYNPDVGFVPNAPTTLPIYEVEDRTYDANGVTATIRVKNNGFYPWLKGTMPGTVPNPQDWPVWVIPPAIEQVDSNGVPIYPDRSTILTVARRYVRLSEVP